MAIFVLTMTTTTRLITLPLVHVRGVTTLLGFQSIHVDPKIQQVLSVHNAFRVTVDWLSFHVHTTHKYQLHASLFLPSYLAPPA